MLSNENHPFFPLFIKFISSFINFYVYKSKFERVFFELINFLYQVPSYYR